MLLFFMDRKTRQLYSYFADDCWFTLSPSPIPDLQRSSIILSLSSIPLNLWYLPYPTVSLLLLILPITFICSFESPEHIRFFCSPFLKTSSVVCDRKIWFILLTRKSFYDWIWCKLTTFIVSSDYVVYNVKYLSSGTGVDKTYKRKVNRRIYFSTQSSN